MAEHQCGTPVVPLIATFSENSLTHWAQIWTVWNCRSTTMDAGFGGVMLRGISAQHTSCFGRCSPIQVPSIPRFLKKVHLIFASKVPSETYDIQHLRCCIFGALLIWWHHLKPPSIKWLSTLRKINGWAVVPWLGVGAAIPCGGSMSYMRGGTAWQA